MNVLTVNSIKWRRISAIMFLFFSFIAAFTTESGSAYAQASLNWEPPIAVASTERCLPGLAALVAVNVRDGNLYRWTRPTPTSGNFTSATRVGTNWTGLRLLASDAGTGDLFGVHQNGSLYRFPWAGTNYANGKLIESGWDNVTQLISAGYGVFYVVKANGNLQWYRWLGSSWALGSGKVIGNGWGQFSKVFGGGDGVIYGISRNSGNLYWYRHVAPQNGYRSWRGPRKVGNGWGSMRSVVGLGGGVIYTIDTKGRLLSYQHRDLVEGGAYWANNGKGQQIGNGWLGYDRIAANPNASPTFPQQCMSQGDGLICGAGGDSKTLYRTFKGIVSPVRFCANGCQALPSRGGYRQDQCASAPGKLSVAIQAGHENTIGNCRSTLVRADGATNEAGWNATISRMVVTKLKAEGIDARQVDANFNCDPLITQHFDAVVSIHYQPDTGIRDGYFIGTVDPVYDVASSKSNVLDLSLDLYYDKTGITPSLFPSYETIKKYYLKNNDLIDDHSRLGFVLSQDTPFALIEAGAGAPGGAQHDILWNQKDLVSNGITSGIISFLNRTH